MSVSSYTTTSIANYVLALIENEWKIKIKNYEHKTADYEKAKASIITEIKACI